MSEYRSKALEEYGEECQVCGEPSNIQVHHRDGDRTNNELKNLLPLCRDCHYRVHHGEIEPLSKELLPTDEREHIPEDGITLNVTIDGDVAEAAENVKESLNLSWRELIEDAVMRADLYLQDGQEQVFESNADAVPVTTEDQVRDIVQEELTAE
jgi:hypothetical protein